MWRQRQEKRTPPCLMPCLPSKMACHPPTHPPTTQSHVPSHHQMEGRKKEGEGTPPSPQPASIKAGPYPLTPHYTTIIIPSPPPTIIGNHICQHRRTAMHATCHCHHQSNHHHHHHHQQRVTACTAAMRCACQTNTLPPPPQTPIIQETPNEYPILK